MKIYHIKIFVILLSLIGYKISIAQSISNSHKISGGIFGGIIAPISDLTSSYNVGFNLGLEFSYQINQDITLCFNSNYNKLIYDHAKSESESSYIIDYTVGIRYFPISKSSLFIEGNIGGHTSMLVENISIDGIYYTSSKTSIGYNVGTGFLLNLSKKFNMITKAIYHNILDDTPNKKYFSIGTGINFNF